MNTLYSRQVSKYNDVLQSDRRDVYLQPWVKLHTLKVNRYYAISPKPIKKQLLINSNAYKQYYSIYISIPINIPLE